MRKIVFVVEETDDNMAIGKEIKGDFNLMEILGCIDLLRDTELRQLDATTVKTPKTPIAQA
jgi:hypothetical protein